VRNKPNLRWQGLAFKSEARNPKSETNPKHEMGNDQNAGALRPRRLGFWVWLLLACLGFRACARGVAMQNKPCAKVSWCNSAGLNPARPKLADRPE
jgi:hypothetical protein